MFLFSFRRLFRVVVLAVIGTESQRQTGHSDSPCGCVQGPIAQLIRSHSRWQASILIARHRSAAEWSPASILLAAALFPRRSQATRRPLHTTLWSCGSGARSVLFHATRPLPLPGRHDHPPALGGVRRVRRPVHAGLASGGSKTPPCRRIASRAAAKHPSSSPKTSRRLLGRVAAPRPSPSGAWRVRNHWPGSGVGSHIAVAVSQVDVWQAGVDASRLHIQGCDHPAVPTSGFTRK